MQNQEIIKIIENLRGRKNYEQKKAKPPTAKYFPYLFFVKIFFNFDNENIN